MKIPNESHKKPYESEKVTRGDVSRELMETKDLITTFIRPLKINEKNGIERLHKTPPKDRYKGYFKKAKVTQEPAGGDAHLVALRTFRETSRKGGYGGGSLHKKSHKIDE